MMQYFEKHL